MQRNFIKQKKTKKRTSSPVLMQSHNLLTITRGRTKKSGNVNMNVVCILGGKREGKRGEHEYVKREETGSKNKKKR